MANEGLAHTPDPPPPATRARYSTLDEPVYYFTLVTLEDGGAIDVTVASEDFDTLVMVFGPGGGRIALNDDDEENAGTDSAVRGVELLEAGKYLIFATRCGIPERRRRRSRTRIYQR